MHHNLRREVLMKKIFFILSFIFAANCFAETQAIQNLDEYLGKMVDAYHIPGMAVFVANPDETLLEKSYGECDSLDRQFFIGSMSKSYTALCIMQLVEQGLVNLADDISLYLPDYKFEKKVTVLSLLNHTSGFDTHAKLHNVKITDSYGKYEYANVNYDLLGKIVESVSGLSYEDYIRRNVFEPLGMGDSTANAWKAKDSPKLLKGNRNYFGFFKKGDAVFPTEKSWFHEPAGYIASTPDDHGKYLRMYLNGGLTQNGERIITQESINSMWYKNVPLGVKEYDAYYGKGWNYMKWNGYPMVFHGGQVENGITYMYILPDMKLAVCFMINANDEFVLNNLMNNVVWDSVSLIRGESVEDVNHNKFVQLHLLYDAIYLLIICLSLIIFIRAVKSRHAVSRGKKRRVVKIILGILAYVLFPLFLLTFTKVLLDTPLWVVRLFVPDLYIVLLVSACLSFVAGIIKLSGVCRRR